MVRITDLNITKIDRAKHSATLRDAYQLIVAGILIRLGFEVGLTFVKGEPYDLIVRVYGLPPHHLHSIRRI